MPFLYNTRTGTYVNVDGREDLTEAEIIEFGEMVPDDQTQEFKLMDAKQAEQVESAPERGIGERITSALFPRTLASAQEGNTFDPVAGIADAASLPGRAIMGGLAAVSQEGEGLLDRGLSSMERTRSTSTFLPARFASDVVRDPLSLALPGAGALAGRVATPTASAVGGRLGAMLREGARVGAEGVSAGAIAGSEEGRAFSPAMAGVAAVPGVAMGAKYVADVPAWARVRDASGVAEDLYRNRFMPTPTSKKAQAVLADPKEFEEAFFKPAPGYGDPLMKDVDSWTLLQDRKNARLDEIGKRADEGLSAPEFSEVVPLSDVMGLPIAARGRIADNVGQSSADEIIEATNVPFYDLYSKLAARTEKGSIGDRRAAMDAMAMLENGGEALAGGIPLREVVQARKMLIQEAKKRGKFSKADQKKDAELNAYNLVLEEAGEYIKKNVPKNERTEKFFSGQQDFAKLLPWSGALDQGLAGRLGNVSMRDQTELGRIGLMLEAPGTLGKLKSVALKSMPEKVDIDNAWRLYDAAGRERAQAAKMAQQGGAGYFGANLMRGVTPAVRARLAQMLEDDAE